MPNTKPVGVAYSDPELVSGTTIDGAIITNPNITGGAYAGSVAATVFSVTPGSIAAAGTDNTNATLITTTGVVVTAGDGTKGAILPAFVGGYFVFVKNGANAILKIYPPSGAAINALTATTGAISLAANVSAIFWFYSATQIYTIPLLPS